MADTGTRRILGLQAATWTAIWFAGISMPAGIAAYYRMVAGFSSYDDEGTLMMSVKQYLGGATLYKEVFSIYGPVYYFYNWLIRTISGTSVDHNATRTTSAVVWVLCSLMCAWIVYQLTESLPVAAVAQFLAFRTLYFFHNEPGHPQELCMLLLLCFAVSGVPAARSEYRWLSMVLVGMLAAALVLIKVNVGIFVILAAALSIVFQMPSNGLVRAGRYAVSGVVLILPTVLMRVHLHDFAIQGYYGVVTVSIAALLVGLSSGKAHLLSARDMWITVASFVTTAAVALLIIWLQGTPFSDILRLVVLQNVKTNVSQPFWYYPLFVTRLWIAWAFAGLFAVVAVRAAATKGRRQNGLLAIVKVMFGVVTLGLGLTQSPKLVGFATPFCWLLLFPRLEEETSLFPRMLLCATTVLQTLYAYPIAGSQGLFVQVLLIVVGAVSCGDFLRMRTIQLRLEALRLAPRAATAVVLLMVALCYAHTISLARRRYLSMTSLALPGAERIRVPAEQAKTYQWLVRNLREYCDGFVSYPEVPSLHLWSDIPSPGPLHESPGPLNLDAWVLILGPAQQEIIARDFARFSSPCVVYIPKLVTFWNKGAQDWSTLPLVKYIQQNFKTAGETNGYYFLFRNDRQLSTFLADPSVSK
jgi:hypothetical protein